MQLYRNGTLEMDEHKEFHITHCLSYLRQSILCNLDTTLEPAREAVTKSGEHVHAAYGTGVEHECRDWTQVRDWMNKNHEEWADDDDFEVT
jgi:L-lactate utilization protein LutB